MSLFSEKETMTVAVQGMHCEKCVARVKEALEAVEGVTEATVSLEEGQATVEGRGFDRDAVLAASRILLS